MVDLSENPEKPRYFFIDLQQSGDNFEDLRQKAIDATPLLDSVMFLPKHPASRLFHAEISQAAAAFLETVVGHDF